MRAKSASIGLAIRDRSRFSCKSAILQGSETALLRFARQADGLAAKELGVAPAAIGRDRELTIILGPPAVGKSTIANEVAYMRNAAILDSDEIKKALPEFQRGVGAAAVHEESSALAGDLSGLMRGRGTNVVLPKVRDNLASIQRQIDLYRESGYSVSIVNMAVSPDTAYRRMIGRFAATGRIIPPSYLDAVGSRPTDTYRALREKGAADGFAEIDNNGGFGDPRPVTDRAGVDPLRSTGFDLGSGGEPRSGAGRGSAGEGRSGDQANGIERTDAGDQILIDGIDPITQRQRLEAAQARPLGGGPRGADSSIGGLFDPLDPVRNDLFDQVPVGIGADADRNAMAITQSKAELRADMDAEDEFVAQLGICLR